MEEQNQSASQRIYKIDTAMLSWLLLLLYNDALHQRWEVVYETPSNLHKLS
jgi:hypothetical protein